MPKRRRTDNAVEEEESTPQKTRRTAQNDSPPSNATTPSNRKSILKGTPTRGPNGTSVVEPTPKSLRKVLFSTPAEKAEAAEEQETPTATRNDRSARRKSARTLQKQPDDESEDGDVAQDTALAEAILDQEDEIVGEDEEEVVVADASSQPTADTPTKRGRGRPRGRPKKERTPSPPPDLPPHELYFFQNRAGANKTSANTLAPNLLLNHEDYLTNINAYKDPHEQDIKRLADLHKRAFDQWTFEREEGFNLCLYGYGSKRQLLMDYADHLYHSSPKPPRIVVVNGYTPGLTLRDIFTLLAKTVLPKSTKLPSLPVPLLDLVLTHLTSNPPSPPITLLVHSLDSPTLRRAPAPALLGRLAAHPFISFIASVDTPQFALLWPPALLRQYNWLYHDTTTFKPYIAEIDVVEEVNALLGRSGRKIGGKDGVAFVLKSLPENARNLFRILVIEQLGAMSHLEADATLGGGDVEDEDEGMLGVSDDEDAAAEAQATPSRRQKRGRPPKKAKAAVTKKVVAPAAEGVEYRTLYHKAVEEFVCSSELSFRTLLKEFHDHQMVESRKDGMGVERLFVPGMGRGELEGLLEELV
ncbi:Origin recognition complex subunit 2 [Saxophila tyrrhenica]|uniref:Origin recognition complex subunit 2 n=1 Tax=Saxophila tyrrhenica TaxID=1690608 RepID=A0AAV9P1F7_9PEZI|nr:Origin recognition complex subunit 2 [Saxophila tyrrhenica]